MTKPNTAHTTMRLKVSFTENFRWVAAGCREQKRRVNERIVRVNDGYVEV